jgi:hypothetical protein
LPGLGDQDHDLADHEYPPLDFEGRGTSVAGGRVFFAVLKNPSTAFGGSRPLQMQGRIK